MFYFKDISTLQNSLAHFKTHSAATCTKIHQNCYIKTLVKDISKPPPGSYLHKSTFPTSLYSIFWQKYKYFSSSIGKIWYLTHIAYDIMIHKFPYSFMTDFDGVYSVAPVDLIYKYLDRQRPSWNTVLSGGSVWHIWAYLMHIHGLFTLIRRKMLATNRPRITSFLSEFHILWSAKYLRV